jgi:hypothetical protein
MIPLFMEEKNESSLDALLLQKKDLLKWHVFWVLASVLLFAFCFHFNWLHWGPAAMVNDDVHREFVTPLRLAQGQVLYKDFNFVYGPLPPYINSAIIRLPYAKPFTLLRITALVLFITTLFLTVLICGHLRVTTLAGPTVFGMIALSSSYTFNPSSFNSAYAEVFALAGILFAVYALKGPAWAWLLLGACTGCAAFSKPEGAFALGLVVLGLLWISRTIGLRSLLIKLLCLATGALACVLPVMLFLARKGLSIKDILEGLLQSRFQSILADGFTHQLNYFFGINHAIVVVLGVVLIVFYCLLLHILNKYSVRPWIAGVVLGMSAGIAFSTNPQFFTRIVNDYINLGAFFGGIAGLWVICSRRHELPTKVFIIFWLFALGGWLRPLFHIGALVIPFRTGGGILMANLFWFVMLPMLFTRIAERSTGPSTQAIRIGAPLAAIALLLFCVTGIFVNWTNQWRHPTICVRTAYGSFAAAKDSEATRRVMEVSQWLKEHLCQSCRFVVLEGLPLELSFGFLPALPFSQLNHQVYAGDSARVACILDSNPAIQYVLVYVHRGWYSLGTQSTDLADYLDEHWQQVYRCNVPAEFDRLSLITPDRMKRYKVTSGFIVLERQKLLTK